MNTTFAKFVRSAVASVGPAVLGTSALLALASSVAMAPEPDPIPRRWQLSVETGPLRVASVEVPGAGTRAYFFITYKVTNATDQDLLFTPSFDLVGDDGVIARAGRDVPAAVTKEIMDRLANPFMQDPVSIVGPLLQGEANAKEGLAIWPVQTTRMSELSLFAAGFSGETRPVEFKNEKGEATKVLLRKCLMLRYQPPGEIRDMGNSPIPLIDKQWIMR